MAKNPFQQGRLDGLCGIYSIVNALQIINNQNKNEAEKVFIDLISVLHEKGALLDAMSCGLFFKDMRELIALDIVKKHCSKIILPFVGKKNPALPDFWRSLSDYLDDKKIEYRTAAIIGMGGKHDHWTVVSSIHGSSMSLQDSFELKRLNRRNCTTSKPLATRHHVIRPAQTFILTGTHKRHDIPAGS